MLLYIRCQNGQLNHCKEHAERLFIGFSLFFLFSMVFVFSAPLAAAEDIILYEENDLWGYEDKDGIPVTEAKWNDAHDFSRYAAFVSYDRESDRNQETRSLDGLIDRDGNYILWPVYDIEEEAYIYRVFLNDYDERLVGYFDKDSGFYQEPVYERILDSFPYYQHYPKSSLIAAKQNGYWGFLFRENGEVAVPFVYEDVMATFSSGFAFVCILPDGGNPMDITNWCYIDESGERLSFESGVQPCSEPSKNGVVIVADCAGALGLASLDGKIIVEPQYPLMEMSYEDTVLFEDSNELWGLMTDMGDILVEPVYKTVYEVAYPDEILQLMQRDYEVW